ncbi:MAG: cyclase family protein [Sedimentisphaerales bacterium]|nr:cyclase family protein [Sedimentisphaerales bacterium]
MTLTHGMVTYPKDLPYQRQLQRSIKRGDSSNVSQLEMSAHTGSHVDSPLHYIEDGYGVSDIPLDHLYGPVQVIDCRGIPAVTADALKPKLLSQTQRLLLKTDNSRQLADNPDGPFNPDFVYLDKSAAVFLAEQGIISLVGIDYLSIDKSGLADKPAHHILLKNKITILEGIVLADIKPGLYFLACGPLKMAESDGAPCRAVLIEDLI